ncbi:NHL repeat-containing protein [Flavisolibacter nicotianae]|uniref:hypothetical protein n=1 Tax=Flavisolibacter nicotianae TaxID=2364882 RepID=UPI000EB46A86|nr:hypothetical protein [Flavisolibacter nicotianae]
MKSFFTFLFLVAATVSFAQKDSSFLLVRTYSGDIAAVAIDNLDNLYVVSSTGQLKKFNSRGDSVGVFNGLRAYGKLQTVDVTNPLRLLLFYKDFSTVVILDRLLASRASIDLRRHNVLQPAAVGLSYDNNIWVFDQYDNKLKKLDESGNLLLETPDFRQLFASSVTPQKIISDNGLVYLADSAQGLFVFDHYGTYKRTIPLKNGGDLDVWSGKVVRLSDGAVRVYNPDLFTEQARRLPPSFTPYLHSFTTGNKLVTYSQDSLRIYRFAD